VKSQEEHMHTARESSHTGNSATRDGHCSERYRPLQKRPMHSYEASHRRRLQGSRVVSDLLMLRKRYSKLDMQAGLIQWFADSPASPDECVFA